MQEVHKIDLSGKNSTERMKEITDRLEAGLRNLFDSEQYKNYLSVMAKFHNYSPNNTMLIAMQMPEASFVAGYDAWKKNFDRHVKAKEQGIKIIAPYTRKAKRNVPVVDPVTQNPMLGADGQPVTAEKEFSTTSFRVVTVFDVSQTEGKELPSIGVQELTGSVEQYQDFFSALEKTSPVPVAFEDIQTGARGYYHLVDHRIAIKDGMSEMQTQKTLIHEIAHAKLHAIDKDATPEELQNRPDRHTREIQAESVAYTVCQHFGLDTSDYSFGYVAGWSTGKEMTELRESVNTIHTASREIISSVEQHFQLLQDERLANSERPVLPTLPKEKREAIQDTVKDALRTLADLDRKIYGTVSQGTMEAYKTQGIILSENMEYDDLPDRVPLEANAEPVVTILWSESSRLRDGEHIPLSRANDLFERIDREQKEQPGYDKTSFRIDYVFHGELRSYEGRQDLGDGEGSLIDHIRGYNEHYLENEDWNNYLLRHGGQEALHADQAERKMILNEIIPYFQLHCNLSEMEREAKRPLRSAEPLTEQETAYFKAVLSYVQEYRPLLNEGNYQFPEQPKLADFDLSLQDYRDQVEAEIQQEAATAGMTVEEYAAAGYEAPVPVPDDHLTGETVKTPRGSFHLTDLTKEQMEAAGYGLHHSSDDHKYQIMGNGTRAFAIRNPDVPEQQSPEQDLVMSAAAFRLAGQGYLHIQECEYGYDYTLYDQKLHYADGGLLNEPDLSLMEARKAILEYHLMELSRIDQIPLHAFVRMRDAAEQTETPSIQAKLQAAREKAAALTSKSQPKQKQERDCL